MTILQIIFVFSYYYQPVNSSPVYIIIWSYSEYIWWTEKMIDIHVPPIEVWYAQWPNRFATGLEYLRQKAIYSDQTGLLPGLEYLRQKAIYSDQTGLLPGLEYLRQKAIYSDQTGLLQA